MIRIVRLAPVCGRDGQRQQPPALIVIQRSLARWGTSHACRDLFETACYTFCGDISLLFRSLRLKEPIIVACPVEQIGARYLIPARIDQHPDLASPVLRPSLTLQDRKRRLHTARLQFFHLRLNGSVFRASPFRVLSPLAWFVMCRLRRAETTASVRARHAIV